MKQRKQTLHVRMFFTCIESPWLLRLSMIDFFPGESLTITVNRINAQGLYSGVTKINDKVQTTTLFPYKGLRAFKCVYFDETAITHTFARS